MFRISAVAFIAAFAVTTSAHAQQSANVKFATGEYGMMLSGKIAGHDYFDYKLGAKAR